MSNNNHPTNYQDLTGTKFHRLLVKGRGGSTKTGQALWLCECECGKGYALTSTYKLKSGHTKSCGCLSRELIAQRNFKHGYAFRGKLHPIYKVWGFMVDRCYRKENKQFKDYGGRGIKVCKEWRHFPEVFIEWSISKGWKKGLELDRKDNNGNYCPENCRFVTKTENVRNCRSNIRVKVFGEELVLSEAVEKYSILSYRQVYSRVKKGWNPERALMEPVDPKKGRSKNIVQLNSNAPKLH